MTEISWLLAGIILGLVVGLRSYHWWQVNLGWKLGKTNFNSFQQAQTHPHPIKESLHTKALLVPILGNAGYPVHALQAGLELALHSGQPLHVIVFIEVPRTHSLESVLDEEVEEAFQLLEQAEQAARRSGVTIITNVARARNNILAVIDAALEIKAGIIIAEQSPDHSGLPKASLVSQAEMIGHKTGANLLLLNSTRLAEHTLQAGRAAR